VNNRASTLKRGSVPNESEKKRNWLVGTKQRRKTRQLGWEGEKLIREGKRTVSRGALEAWWTDRRLGGKRKKSFTGFEIVSWLKRKWKRSNKKPQKQKKKR